MNLLAVTLAFGGSSAAGIEWSQLLGTMGSLHTVAGGNGQSANNGNEWQAGYEGGLATVAELSEPHMAMDDVFGNIYVADKNAHAIRKITPDGKIYTVAGRHEYHSPNYSGYDGDGVATAKLLAYPNGLFVFPDGTFFILEQGDAAHSALPRIRKVDRAGNMTTILTHTSMNRGLWVRPDEQLIYFCSNSELLKWTPSGGIQTLADFGTGDPSNIDVSSTGMIYVTDRARHCVFAIPPAGVGSAIPAPVAGRDGSTSTLLGGGDGGLANRTALEGARGIAFHPLGGYLVCTHKGGDVWYVEQAGVIHLLISGTSGNDFEGENQPIAGTTTVNKIAEPRAVRVGWNGDIIITTNDSGYIRLGLTVCPPRKVSLTISPARTLAWTAQSNEAYLIERSVNLAQWQTLTTSRPVSGGPQIYSDPNAPGVRAFYRMTPHRTWPF